MQLNFTCIHGGIMKPALVTRQRYCKSLRRIRVLAACRFISGFTSFCVANASVPKNNVYNGATNCIEDQSNVLNRQSCYKLQIFNL